MEKEYTIHVHHNGHVREYTGTVDHLIDEVFGYTLECNGMGTSFKRPKTARTLVNRLNTGRSYWSITNFYELVK